MILFFLINYAFFFVTALITRRTARRRTIDTGSTTVSFVGYLLAGFVPNALVVLPVSVALLLVTLLIIKTATKKKA